MVIIGFIYQNIFDLKGNESALNLPVISGFLIEQMNSQNK